jgi:hypothetical protein
LYRWYITHAIPDDVISQLQARTTEHNNAKILKLHQMNLYLILKWDSGMCSSREREVWMSFTRIIYIGGGYF